MAEKRQAPTSRARAKPKASPSPSGEPPPVSRPRPSNIAFVASATRVRLSAKPIPRRTEQWQSEAWGAYDNVGEIQHGVDFLANQISKIRLFGALVPENPRLPPAPDPDSLADSAIRALHSKTSSTYTSILREGALNLYVPGEVYLVGFGASTVEGADYWDTRSADELEIGDGVFKVRDFPGGPIREYKDGQVVVIRIHISHPRYSDLPISPLRGILSSAEEIQRIERVIRGAARSRSAGAGLLLIPEDVSVGPVDPTSESAATDTDDPFYNALMAAMMTPIEDEGNASSVVPLMVRGPAESLREMRRLDLAIDINTELIKLDRAITRLAQGLPLPPEIVTGKAQLSHWTSFSVDEQTITAYVEPFTVPIIDALTLEYYRPFLIAAGMSEAEAETRMLWYDVTPLITRPNRSADADYGLDHIALSDAAWRRIKGFDETDKPSKLEILSRLVVQRGSFDPVFTSVLLKELGLTDEDAEHPALEIRQPPTTQPNSPAGDEADGPPDSNQPKTAGPRNPRGPGMNASIIVLPSNNPTPEDISASLVSLDRDLRTRLHSAAEAATHRALERANSSIKSKLTHVSRYTTLLRDVPKLEIASRIGSTALHAEGITYDQLLANSFDSMRSRFVDWTTRTYAKVSRLLEIPISPPVEVIESAADSLIASLHAHACDRLNSPRPTPELSGEYDDRATIPIDIIRQSMRRAGGGGPELLPSNASPPTGVATGPIVLQSLLTAGWGLDGWEWCYPTHMLSREFDAHANLDGVRFSAFNDPVLANPGTFPAVPYLYPGDHSSCSCELRPVLTTPA